MAGVPAEVSLAINPARPGNVIAVSLATGLEVRSTNFSFVSHDGGLTWSSNAALNPEQRVQGDDSVVFNHKGQAFRSYISFRGLRNETPTPSNGIFVSSSADGGRTWNEPVAVVDHQNTITPFEDKPYLVVDALPESPPFWPSLSGLDPIRSLRQQRSGGSVPHLLLPLLRRGPRLSPHRFGFRTREEIAWTATRQSKALSLPSALAVRSTWSGPGPGDWSLMYRATAGSPSAVTA